MYCRSRIASFVLVASYVHGVKIRADIPEYINKTKSPAWEISQYLKKILQSFIKLLENFPLMICSVGTVLRRIKLIFPNSKLPKFKVPIVKVPNGVKFLMVQRSLFFLYSNKKSAKLTTV
jgi:hypothetical protein